MEQDLENQREKQIKLAMEIDDKKLDLQLQRKTNDVFLRDIERGGEERKSMNEAIDKSEKLLAESQQELERSKK